MDQQNSYEFELLSAWRALSSSQEKTGMQTIKINNTSLHPILAGRISPENEETLLIGFSLFNLNVPSDLPQGNGFFVKNIKLIEKPASFNWITIFRQNNGNIDFFSKMSADIIRLIENNLNRNDEEIEKAIFARIIAWQDFMKRNSNYILSQEEEIGLYGEIEVMASLIEAGNSPADTVKSWEGPIHGIQDFKFGKGAIEVKSTDLPIDFFVHIGSLEQLDDSIVNPLFIATMRFSIDLSGKTLPERAMEIRNYFSGDLLSTSIYDSKLIHAGLIVKDGNMYNHRYLLTNQRILQVSNDFPKLTTSNVPIQIKKVSYEININMITTIGIPMHEILSILQKE